MHQKNKSGNSHTFRKAIKSVPFQKYCKFKVDPNAKNEVQSLKYGKWSQRI